MATKYFCDRCDFEHKRNELAEIVVTVGPRRSSYTHTQTGLLCETCLGSLNLGMRNGGTVSKNSYAIPTPTLEDLIRSIVREEVESSD